MPGKMGRSPQCPKIFGFPKSKFTPHIFEKLFDASSQPLTEGNGNLKILTSEISEIVHNRFSYPKLTN